MPKISECSKEVQIAYEKHKRGEITAMEMEPWSNDLSSADEISRRADAPLQDVLNMPLGKEYFFERGRYPVLSKSYDVFADATYHEMLKVAAKAEREEAKQKRIETEEMMKELAEMEAAIENKEEAFHDFIADLSNLDEE